MSRLQTFEDFLNEASNQRTATVKTETTAEINRKLEKLLREAAKLNEEVEVERAKFEQAIKIKELELRSKQNAILLAMQEMGTTMLKFKKILATIENTKGRTTYPYAKLWEYALDQANENQKKVLVEYKEINKKVNPDKLKVEIKKVNEGLGDILNGIWNFLKDKAKQIKAAFGSYTESVDALEAVVNAGAKAEPARYIDHGGEEL
jgi:hypothetical protein